MLYNFNYISPNIANLISGHLYLLTIFSHFPHRHQPPNCSVSMNLPALFLIPHVSETLSISLCLFDLSYLAQYPQGPFMLLQNGRIFFFNDQIITSFFI